MSERLGIDAAVAALLDDATLNRLADSREHTTLTWAPPPARSRWSPSRSPTGA